VTTKWKRGFKNVVPVERRKLGARRFEAQIPAIEKQSDLAPLPRLPLKPAVKSSTEGTRSSYRGSEVYLCAAARECAE